VIVVGTGTEVGKTHVCMCLLAQARARGLRVRAYKPVATGVTGECEDSARHAEALGTASVPPTFGYVRPVSPHLAAREEGRPIDLEAIARVADEMTPGTDLLLVETAGGLFSPLSETLTNADLVRRLGPAAVLLVAPDRIGVLGEVRAFSLAAKASGITLSWVVLSAPAQGDASTGTNAGELEALGLGPVSPVFRRAPFDAKESLDAAARVLEALAPSIG